MLRISLSGLPCAYSTTEWSNSPRVTKSMSWLAFSVSSGLMCPCGPTNAIFRLGFPSLILRISLTSLSNPTVDVNKIRNSYSLQISTVCCQLTLCGDASSSRLPGIMPAGYVSHTGYQYDSISRVAGHRELAPPSKFSKLGGFNSNVFITSGILHPQPSLYNLGRFRELGSALDPRNGRSARTRIDRPPNQQITVYLISSHPLKPFC